MITRRPLLALLSSLGALPRAASAKDARLQGSWSGVLDAGVQKLRLRLDLTADGRAVLYSLDQGGAPIPADVVSLTPERVEIAVPMVQGRFTGKLAAGDRLEGAWSQGGGALPLVLVRGGEAPASPPPEPLTPERLADLRRRADAPALAAAAQAKGKPARLWLAGEREVGSGRSVTEQDRWHLGSITKSMTATQVARLVEAGRLAWDDTVGARLAGVAPDMRPDYRAATLRHLLSHRAGLPANIPIPELVRFPRDSADAREDRRAFARSVLSMPPTGRLGDRFEYANTGYVLAGAMVEQALGVTWEAAIRDHLFRPLGLATAGFGAPAADANPLGHAPGLDGRLRPFRPGADPTDNPAVLGPAGRVHMSLHDLMTYLAAHRDRAPLLSPRAWSALHTPPFGGDYAMGWIVRADGALWHNGSNTLWYAEALFRPAGSAAAAIANDGRTATAGPAVSQALASALLAV